VKGTVTTIKPFGERETQDPTTKAYRRIRTGGFGFIKDENGQDRFFLARDVETGTFSPALEGLAAEFEPAHVPGKGNGLRALHIHVTL
jgi:cold shock CspA family protein